MSTDNSVFSVVSLFSKYILFKKKKKRKKIDYIAVLYRNGQKFYSNSGSFWNPILLCALHFM